MAIHRDWSGFKAYDIRGQVPAQLDAELAYQIGRAFVDEINPGVVVVGFDVRLESPMLANALRRGLTEAGADVIDIGLCGTEEVYFQTFHREDQGVGGGIMITASHNPKGYNGMKLVREGARPVSGDTGLFAIRDRVKAGEFKSQDRVGNVRVDTDNTAYIQHLLGYVDVSVLKPLKIVADPGNGGAGPVMRLLEKHLPFNIHYIHEQPDGNFPQGVPNPLLPEMRDATSKAVVEHGADVGIAWDGDFDRCFLFDAQGRFIEGYYLVGMIPWLLITELMSKTGKTLAELVDERMAAYPCSGEINYRVEDVPGSIERVLAHFSPMNPKIDRTDGVSVEFDDWRFNLRGSNTEPLLRLNVETRRCVTPIQWHVAEIENLIW
jgi:phosphomannomutase/phosphoglucomutase